MYLPVHVMSEVQAGISLVPRPCQPGNEVMLNLVTFFFWSCSYRNGVRYELEDEVSFENLKNFMNAVLA